MARPGIVLTVVAVLSVNGCSSISMFGDPSLVLDNVRAPSWNVENGAAYDRASVELGVTRTVVVPGTAIVRQTAESGPIRLFMEKRLGFVGHPTELWSIRESRKNMGCAMIVEGDKLVIGTFGEFQTIEGGADMRLVVIVPKGLSVEHRKGLSGHHSAAESQEEGPYRPASGWKAVRDEPDPDRTAQEMKD